MNILILFILFVGCKNPEDVIPQNSPSIGTESDDNIKIGGTYSFGKDLENGSFGSVLIYPISEKTALFYLDLSSGKPSFNSDQLLGQINIKNNEGFFQNKESNCLLNFRFLPNKLSISVIDGQNNCGFPKDIYPDRTYHLTNSTIPTHFYNVLGEEVRFDLLVEQEQMEK